MGWAAMVAVVLVAVVTVGIPSVNLGSSHVEGEGQRGEPAPSVQFGGSNDSISPPYEALFGSTPFAEAQRAVDFEIQMPKTPWASRDLLTGAYLLPGGAVALDFPPPDVPKAPLAQSYIEVYEAPWSFPVEPLEFYERSLTEDPNPDSSIIDVDGLSALVVTPRSELDDEKDNPAFLRVVVNKVELQISGGEDLDRLIAIASSMIQAANASK